MILAQIPVVRDRVPMACTEMLATLLKDNPRYTSFSVIERDGMSTCFAVPPTANPTRGLPIVLQGVVAQAFETRGWAVSGYGVGPYSGRRGLGFAYPILDEAKQTRAVVTTMLDVVSLNDLAAQSLLPPGSSLTANDRAGHDRGARVAHRLTVDHPGRVLKLAALDISPTLKMYESTNREFAQAYYHWFFFIQPQPMPEKLIGGDSQFYLLKKIGSGSAGLAPFTPEALSEYLCCFTSETIHGSCEDYRASASIELEFDRADIRAGRKITCSLLALWGKRGVIERCFAPLQDWAEIATDVRGHSLDGSHYLAEELPDEIFAEFKAFFL
jgi:hypothetical protein